MIICTLVDTARRLESQHFILPCKALTHASYSFMTHSRTKKFNTYTMPNWSCISKKVSNRLYRAAMTILASKHAHQLASMSSWSRYSKKIRVTKAYVCCTTLSIFSWINRCFSNELVHNVYLSDYQYSMKTVSFVSNIYRLSRSVLLPSSKAIMNSNISPLLRRKCIMITQDTIKRRQCRKHKRRQWGNSALCSSWPFNLKENITIVQSTHKFLS
jgi:hypothetical protein